MLSFRGRNAANKENHASMETIAARKANEIPDKIHHVIAIEFLRAFQALNLSINRTV